MCIYVLIRIMSTTLVQVSTGTVSMSVNPAAAPVPATYS